MEIEPRDRSQLTREILLGFHTQFAENQRSREQSFLRILAFLAVPVVGYAYAYLYYIHDSQEYPIGLREFCYVQIISSLLITAGTWTIVIIANNFRRDQFVNARIREAVGVLGNGKIFPTNYDPKESFKNKALFKWMPDFLFAFYVLFIFVHGVLLYVFLGAVKPTVWWVRGDVDCTLTLTVVLTSLLLGVSAVIMPICYRREIVLVMGVDTKEYSVRRAWGRCLRPFAQWLKSRFTGLVGKVSSQRIVQRFVQNMRDLTIRVFSDTRK